MILVAVSEEDSVSNLVIVLFAVSLPEVVRNAAMNPEVVPVSSSVFPL